ncbi:MAG TPA: S-adenosyl-l-methionine hydroxide adenosyltransferase family protein [Candidatus Angelobacter sp.]|nr:S-adenosyl-l-methionine hydroxide adenosyltransferase family protein [Candidatus Angelobacter sp.]
MSLMIRKRTTAAAVVLTVLLTLPGVAQRTTGAEASPIAAGHTIVFMTDFGLVDDSVAICKAVMLRVDPGLRIMDITHQVTPYSILDGARFLAGTTPYYGPGAVFVVVIDPGVGSARKAIVARSKLGQYFVVPDNGLLTMVADRDGVQEAREITNPEWMIGGKLSSTFHGRDIFAPVGAHLARGDDWTQVGPVVARLVRLDLKPAKLEPDGLSGEVIATDGPYGNLITNIDAGQFAQLGYGLGDRVQFSVAGKTYSMPFVRTFSDVAKGQPLLYIDSRGNLAIAVNQGNAQKMLHVTPPSRLLLRKKQ